MQFLLLVALVLTSIVVVCGVGVNNNSSFTKSQKKFLRKLLQEEAQGLKSAFAMPSVRWFKMSTSPVCFGARGNSFGLFTVEAEGFIGAMKLVHASGSLTCDNTSMAKKPDQFNSKWGCHTSHPFLGKTSINTVVTTANNKIVFPRDHHFTHEHGDLWYHLEQFDSMSDILVFQRFDNPLYVTSGQNLRIWYGEDLRNSSEDDNQGSACAEVFALYV